MPYLKNISDELQQKVDDEFENTWKDLVCNEDGSVNLEAVKRELYDYSTAMELVAQVYDELCNLSKIHTDPYHVISRTYERMEGVEVIFLPKEPEKIIETVGKLTDKYTELELKHHETK